MKVYVITSGEYSDYHICAVSLSHRNAKILKEKFDHDDYTGARIEEFDTDDYNGILIGKRVYGMEFDESGNCCKINDCCTDGLNSYQVESCKEPPSFYKTSKRCYVYVMARSPEAAIKIGAERRAKFLAENMGL